MEMFPLSNFALRFDHVHLISEDPGSAANWYVEMLGAEVVSEYKLRDAPQINVSLGAVTVIIRGKRSGETPQKTNSIHHFPGYSSHNEWGMDHFGFIYEGDLQAYCDELRAKGAEFAVEPWEFSAGSLLCYLSAPDGVSIELVQARSR